MAKNKKLMGWVLSGVALAVTLAVAGLFLDGTTLANPVLGYIPEIVHTVIGWGSIVIAVVDFASKFMK